MSATDFVFQERLDQMKDGVITTMSHDSTISRIRMGMGILFILLSLVMAVIVVMRNDHGAVSADETAFENDEYDSSGLFALSVVAFVGMGCHVIAEIAHMFSRGGRVEDDEE